MLRSRFRSRRRGMGSRSRRCILVSSQEPARRASEDRSENGQTGDLPIKLSGHSDLANSASSSARSREAVTRGCAKRQARLCDCRSSCTTRGVAAACGALLDVRGAHAIGLIRSGQASARDRHGGHLPHSRRRVESALLVRSEGDVVWDQPRKPRRSARRRRAWAGVAALSTSQHGELGK